LKRPAPAIARLDLTRSIIVQASEWSFILTRRIVVNQKMKTTVRLGFKCHGIRVALSFVNVTELNRGLIVVRLVKE
jgi:hypothetical protein